MKIESKIYVSQTTMDQLQVLKARTGLTPNIICRFALMAQSSDKPLPKKLPPQDVGGEFNKTTLLGDYEAFFSYLPSLQNAPLGRLVDRGVESIYPRVHSLENLVELALG